MGFYNKHILPFVGGSTALWSISSAQIYPSHPLKIWTQNARAWRWKGAPATKAYGTSGTPWHAGELVGRGSKPHAQFVSLHRPYPQCPKLPECDRKRMGSYAISRACYTSQLTVIIVRSLWARTTRRYIKRTEKEENIFCTKKLLWQQCSHSIVKKSFICERPRFETA